jgi:hypothetical protein
MDSPSTGTESRTFLQAIANHDHYHNHQGRDRIKGDDEGGGG